MPTAGQWVRCPRCGAGLTLAGVPTRAPTASRSPWPYPLLLLFTFVLGTAVPAAGFVAFAFLALGGIAVVVGRLSRSLAAVMFGRSGSKEQLVPWAILDIGAGVVLSVLLVVTKFVGVDGPRNASSVAPAADRVAPVRTVRVPVQMGWQEFRDFVVDRGLTRVRAVDMREDGVKLQAGDGGEGWVSAWFERDGDDRPFRLVNLGSISYGSLHEVLEVYLGVRPPASVPDVRRPRGGTEFFDVHDIDGRRWVLEISNARTEVNREVLLCDPTRWSDCFE
jgi:hypothetical protein